MYMYMFMNILWTLYVRFPYSCMGMLHIHIYPLFVVRKMWDEGRESEKGRMDEEGMENGFFQSELFLFLVILPNVLISKGLFDVKFVWVMMMMIKIKIIITILFLGSFFFLIYNYCVVKGYVILYLWPGTKNDVKIFVAFAIIIIIIKKTL